MRKAVAKDEFDLVNNVEWLELYRENPVIAAEDLLMRNGRNLTLPPHQRIILKDLWSGTPFPMLILTRGGAKSTTVAIYFALRAMLFGNERLGIVSASFRQARSVFDEIITFYNDSPILQACSVKAPSKGNIECSWLLKNNSVIKALPIGDGTKVRGQRFWKIFIDEFAQVDKTVIDLAIIPMLATRKDPTSPPEPNEKGNQIILASTATWQFNWAYERFMEYKAEVAKGNDKYSVHEFDCDDLGDFMDKNAIEYSKKHSPRVVFLMEYKNYWPKDSSGWFPASLVQSIKSGTCIMEEKGNKNDVYVMGIDPARESDFFVIMIVKISQNGNKVVKIESHHKPDFPRMNRRIRQLLRDFNVARIAIDYGGGGLAVRDMLAEEFLNLDEYTGEHNVEEPILPIDEKQFPDRVGKRILDVVYFSPKEIHQMNVDLKADMEHKRILIPKEPVFGDDEVFNHYQEFKKLEEELISIITTVRPSGIIHFDTPSKSAIKDRYTAMLLANKAARDYIRLKSVPVEKKQPLAVGFWV